MALSRYSHCWGASKAAEIAHQWDKRTSALVLASDIRQMETLASELRFFLPSHNVLEFPEFTQEPFEDARILSVIMGKRANTLFTLSGGQPSLVITTPYALLKRIPVQKLFTQSVLTISAGTVAPRGGFGETLDLLGYVPVEFVSGPGEFALRGGIVDIFPIDAEYPVRIEFFDDEVEELFAYSPDTQLRRKTLKELVILPATELIVATDELALMVDDPVLSEKISSFGKYAGSHWLAPLVHEMNTLMDWLPADAHCYVTDEEWRVRMERVGVTITDRLANAVHPGVAANFALVAEMAALVREREGALLGEMQADGAEALKYRSTKGHFTFEKNNIYQSLAGSVEVLKGYLRQKMRVVVAIDSQKFSEMFTQFLRDYSMTPVPVTSVDDLPAGECIALLREKVSGGYIDREAKLVIVADEDIFGFTRKKARPKRKEVFSTSVSDLEAGDFVVHVDYGIGVYRGLESRVIGGIQGDYISIEYEGGELLYVPLSAIGLLQKYIGMQDSSPRLSSLRSSAWNKVKQAAQKTARKIAQDLLRLYAERKIKKGFSFRDDGEILSRFEQSFPFDETEDQLAAILDVYRDMESDLPMERLVCGDVGFGKTEVAMRAACKAVAGGKQVGLLVPTTVLARQHFDSFQERFKGLPVKVDFVSRLRTSKEIKEIGKKLAGGEIDVLVGTHRVLSKDIAFKDLGLLIIDEEQRFGVGHKEKIQAMRSNIDVLTLTATPIPRTLQLSLSGIRDMSVIETPPEDRLPVIVRVIRQDDDVKKAVIGELARGGQVFFLHNRVDNITQVAAELRVLVPHAKIGVAHGQMEASEMEDVLYRFYHGEIDILVSTTIIENGIDIPNANTIIINNAGNFGLAQLYQLKGRVGRGNKRGFCYLVVRNMSGLNEVAQKRLKIIQQLSDLGSGFKIAMYDLQLRGAGNLLGAEQSGFVVKIGYELFVRMIDDAVQELRGALPHLAETEVISQIPYYIPAEYVENPHIRFDWYRRFASVRKEETLREILKEITHASGEPGPETMSLAWILFAKNCAAEAGVAKLAIFSSSCRITFSPDTAVRPAELMQVLASFEVKSRFAGEFELMLAFEKPETMLKTLCDILTRLTPVQDTISLPENSH